MITAVAFTPWNVAGLTLAVGTAAVVATCLWAAVASARRPAAVIAIGALTFQAVHVLEHVLQFGYWVGNPGDKLWLTPWAAGTAEGVGYWCTLISSPNGGTTLGNEFLHLLGNGIFLGGLVTLTVFATFSGSAPLRTALAVQGFHVAEHVVLTASFMFAGKAYGVSTVFGELSGTWLTAWRVLFHFGINAVATYYACRAVWQVRRASPVAPEPHLAVAPA